MKKLSEGCFVKYVWNPKDVGGPYALVFRLRHGKDKKRWTTAAQVVWFHTINHCKKYNLDYMDNKYSISGIVYMNAAKDCKVINKPPKYVLKRVEESLLYVIDREKDYYDGKFTNLDMVELLAKIKNLYD